MNQPDINFFSMDYKKIENNNMSSDSFIKKTQSYYHNKLKKTISKYKMKNRSETENIFINPNKLLHIFNPSKIEKNDKNETNLYNNFMSFSNKTTHFNKNGFITTNINNSIDEKINNINSSRLNFSSIISDNSKNTIVEMNYKEKIGEKEKQKNIEITKEDINTNK